MCCSMQLFAMPVTVSTFNAIICDVCHSQYTLINQYINIWSYSPVGSFFQPQNTLNFNHGLSYLGNLHLLVSLPLSESKDQEQVSLPYIQLPFQNVTVARADTCPFKHHEDKTKSEYCQNVYCRVFAMFHYGFFCS